MAIKNCFKSKLVSCKYIFKSGKEANFINYEYITDIESEIEELNAEVALQHPTIFIDEKRKTVDTNKMDPMEEIKAKAIAEYIANQAKSVDKNNDRGNTTESKLNVANSTTIASGAAGSSSGTPGVSVNLSSKS